ncbi:MAG TPA: Ig-like domain-containing protein [Thermoanaerobaculia bacterium]|nr:Ig-like domain-containing protein [Thermoanaerobaculia bacterium]
MILFAVLAGGCSRKPAAIEVSPRPVRIFGLERSQRLTGRVVDKKGRLVQSGSLTWSSSRSDVVAVDGSGRLQSKSAGRAVVVASFEKLSTEIPVEVVDLKTIEITPTSARLVGPVGTTMPLSAVLKNSKGTPVSWPVSWSSSRPAAATVSQDGTVTAVGPGIATIIGRAGDLQGASEITVVVGDISRLEIRPATALVRVGDSQRFEVVAYGPDGKSYEGSAAAFHSSDSAVATVDGAGVASGIATGTATIKATVAGVSAQATLLIN